MNVSEIFVIGFEILGRFVLYLNTYSHDNTKLFLYIRDSTAKIFEITELFSKAKLPTKY